MLYTKRIVVYPANCAMYGAIEIKIFGGWLVIFPPIKSFGKWRKLRIYWSPNATSWHHGMIPIWRSKKSVSCYCGTVDCTVPFVAALERINYGT